MEDDVVILLNFLRNDGKRERSKVTNSDISQAREVAEEVLRVGSGLYTEVDICIDEHRIETIQRLDLIAAGLKSNDEP